MPKQKFILISAIFLLFTLLFVVSINYFFKKEQSLLLNQQTTIIKQSYLSTERYLSDVAEVCIHRIQNNEHLIKDLSAAADNNSSTRNAMRDRIYDRMSDSYAFLQSKGVRQLHFHLPNNESFLRFHKPGKFGDNLSDVRYSVKMANQNKKVYKGFEEGRISNGFRYVTPLFDLDKHIGSVEVSFSFATISSQFEHLNTDHVSFLIDKSIVDEKVFETEKHKYTNSLISENYLIENSFIHYKGESKEILRNIDAGIKDEIREELAQKNDFTMCKNINGQCYMISFVFIKNVEGNPAACIVAYQESELISQNKRQMIFVEIVVLLLLSISAWFSLNIVINNHKINTQNIQLSLQTKELNEANQTKNKFISILSHDLKSPFSTLIGYADLLKRKAEAKSFEDLNNIASYMKEVSSDGYKLLENLLNWVRMHQGRIPFSPKNHSLKEICSTPLSLHEKIAHSKNISINCEIDKNLSVFADIDMIHAVLRNLISNAVKFTNENGNIIISAEKEKDTISVFIKDDGIGMSKDKLNKLFKAELNISSKGTKGEHGTGMGLLLCMEYVHKNGGEIAATSEIGFGSTFSFTVPAS